MKNEFFQTLPVAILNAVQSFFFELGAVGTQRGNAGGEWRLKRHQTNGLKTRLEPLQTTEVKRPEDVGKK